MATAEMDLKTRDSIIKPGEFAPDFTLQTIDRKEWRLADSIKAHDTILCFFPFAFTGVCGTEMKCISKELGDWSKRGTQVVGVSCDSPFALKAWSDQEGFKHPILSDQHRKVCKAYGLFWADMNTTNRGTVVIGKSPDGRGKVKWSQAREPKNAMNWDEVLAAVS